MRAQIWATSLVAGIGTASMLVAVWNERMMHRHRQPGVDYLAVTMRRDGGWRRTDLFTPAGLRHQAKAARFGVIGLALWIAALVVWVLLA